MGLEELLQDTGGFGRFQVINICILYLGKLFGGWSMFQMTFAGMVPEFTCESSDGGDDLGFGKLAKNVTTNECLVPLNISVTSSDKAGCMTFDYTSPYKTVMKDFDLVCDRSWIKSTLTSIQMAGLMLGCIVSGQMGDSMGRWKTNLFFVVLHNVANIAAAFSPGWEVFAVCRFIIGAGIGGTLVVAFTHAMEFMVKKWRPACAALPAWMMGVAMFSLNAWLLQDWRTLHLVCGAVGFIQVPLLFLVPESIRWLAIKGRIDQAVATADKMARWNGRPQVAHARSTLEEVYKQKKKAKESGERYTYIEIFRPWSTAKVTLIMCFHWFCYSMTYYGISFGVSNLAGNFFLNVFLLGIMDTPFHLATFFAINKFGRKWSALSFVVVTLGCASTCLILILVAGVGGQQSIAITYLSLLAKTMTSEAWVVMQTWGNELYPTVTRNLGYGAANTAARVSGILAPLVINFDTRMTESYILMLALLVVDVVLIFLLPDTKGLILPDTRADMTDLGQNEKDKSVHKMELVVGTITDVSSQHDKNGTSLEKTAYINGGAEIHDEGEENVENGRIRSDDGFTNIRL